MCLYSDINEIKIAEKDIVCYKVIQNIKDVRPALFEGKTYHINLDKFNCGDVYFEYVTPFYTCPVIFGKLYHEEFFERTVREIFSFKLAEYLYTEFNGDMFHSYMDKDSCSCIEVEGAIIVKCIIPKGSKYIVGEDYDMNICYGSETIIYKEIIE